MADPQKLVPDLVRQTTDVMKAGRKARLSRLLFVSDPEVRTFVAVRAESEDPERYWRAMRIAWHSDEHGWRTRAEERAERALSDDEMIQKHMYLGRP
jgi:hypothetical protein